MLTAPHSVELGDQETLHGGWGVGPTGPGDLGPALGLGFSTCAPSQSRPDAGELEGAIQSHSVTAWILGIT